MKTTRYVKKSDRNPEPAKGGQVAGNVVIQPGRLVTCEACGRKRIAGLGPHAVRFLGDGRKVDCVGNPA